MIFDKIASKLLKNRPTLNWLMEVNLNKIHALVSEYEGVYYVSKIHVSHVNQLLVLLPRTPELSDY